ncbi:hypothetical protein CF95_gp065 [Erwinia phage PhiEaH1]|uniref:Uncharacterized protein n=1 Tax=Erwinia phage PhiEaH1 TaxID=1401669 RepID=W8CZD8_9CAUD|nr:hypothetical protein CF95_gp065 [Erwinia phage PhiEaH1]AGX01787.1 hypothetical protein [Erwinia phage PhiEaH1]
MYSFIQEKKVMYNNFDNKKKLIYVQMAAATMQDLLNLTERAKTTALNKPMVASLQSNLAARLPGLVAETERSEQVWLEGMLKNSQNWRDIILPDFLAVESQMVDFISEFVRDVEHQLFIVGGSDRLKALLDAVRDIYEVHYKEVQEKYALNAVVHDIHKRLGQEVAFQEFDPHHRDYLVDQINSAKTLTGLRAILNNAVYHFNLEMVYLRKEQQVQAGASKTGGSLKAQ